jgi:hypothetical protein
MSFLMNAIQKNYESNEIILICWPNCFQIIKTHFHFADRKNHIKLSWISTLAGELDHL